MEAFKPAKARAKLPKELTDQYVCEEKFDGSRYLLYIGFNPYDDESGSSTFLSQYESSKDGLYVNKARNVPHITADFDPAMRYTVLDGEATLPGYKFYDLNGLMNSLPDRAWDLQEEKGLIQYNVFDCLAFRGSIITDQPLLTRRAKMCVAAGMIANKHIQIVPQWGNTAVERYFEKVVLAGGEGLIIKDTQTVYGKGWSKMKKSFDVSCIVMGFKPGTKKYEGQMGALQLGVYDDYSLKALATDKPELREVGFASGMDDALRQHITDHPFEYLHHVVDIHAQELTDAGRLRHPTFIRFRDDVSPESITLEKLREDFALENAKPDRSK